MCFLMTYPWLNNPDDTFAIYTYYDSGKLESVYTGSQHEFYAYNYYGFVTGCANRAGITSYEYDSKNRVKCEYYTTFSDPMVAFPKTFEEAGSRPVGTTIYTRHSTLLRLCLHVLLICKI